MKKSFLLISLVCIISATAWYLYSVNKYTSQIYAVKNNKQLIVTYIPKNSKNSWTTFTSKSGGFSFKYPGPDKGWSITSYENGGPPLLSSQLTGNERRIWVQEDNGHNLSSNKAQFWINMNILDSALSAQSMSGRVSYSYGKVVASYPNKIQLWQTTDNTYRHVNLLKCGFTNNSAVWSEVSSDKHLYMPLPNGKFLNVIAGFCLPPSSNKLALGYQHQSNNMETATLRAILMSIRYQ